MHEFLSALNDLDDRKGSLWHSKPEERERGSVMDIVISTTRSKIERAFSDGAKLPAKLKVEAAD